jgi:predicted dehydrogenase
MYVSIDAGEQELEVWRLERRGHERPAIDGGPVAIEKNEPLKLELADFTEAIRTKRKPRVDGDAGRRALELATRVAEAIDRGSNGFPGVPRGS